MLYLCESLDILPVDAGYILDGSRVLDGLRSIRAYIYISLPLSHVWSLVLFSAARVFVSACLFLVRSPLDSRARVCHECLRVQWCGMWRRWGLGALHLGGIRALDVLNLCDLIFFYLVFIKVSLGP